MAASDHLEQRVIDHVLNAGTEFTLASTASVYVALFTDATTDAGGGTECTGTNYARVTVTADFSTMTGVTDGNTTNLSEIAFAQASDATWGTITNLAIYDAATIGNMLYHGALDSSKVIDTNDTFKIAIGDLSVTLS